MRVNDRTIELIKRFEGLRLEAYKDAAGVWTIGYGHTSRAGHPRVHKGMVITEEDAERILRRDVEKFADKVAMMLGDTVGELNENQFGALVSFAYNVGPGNFRRSSVFKAVKEGRHDDVPKLLMRWVRARGRVLRGLVRRRKAEGELYMTPVNDDVSDQLQNDKSSAKIGVGKAVAMIIAGLAALAAAFWDWLMRLFGG